MQTSYFLILFFFLFFLFTYAQHCTMRAQIITAVVSLVSTGFAAALPTEIDMGLYNFLSKRGVSPDNTCGNLFSGGNNYTCDATKNNGACCSQYGYCGNTTDYCDTGCQIEFGTCTPSSVQPGTDESMTCGPLNSNSICGGGLCCSPSGYCGNSTDYCGDGCQSAFGTCTPGSEPPASGGTCGPNFGGAVCTDNQCCSMSGYCGTSSDFCADPGSCMPGDYGRCDSDTTPAGESTINVTRIKKGSVSYTEDIYACLQTNVVALTYDDGPYIYTAELLDLLKKYGFTATFFMTGNNNGKGQIDTTAPYPDLIKRMVAEGHQVASHTWSHYSLSNVTKEQRIQQMVKNEMALNNIIGMWPTYMRPPYSDCTEASGCWEDMEALGYHRISFDLDTQDYLNPLTTQVQKSKDIVTQALAKGGVSDYLSIQHDIVQQSVTNLSTHYFDIIKSKGWRGVTAGECLQDDKANWYRSFDDSSSSSSSSSTMLLSTTASRSPTNSLSTSVPGATTPAASTSTGKSCSTKSTKTTTSGTSSTTTSSKSTSSGSTSPKPTCAAQSSNWCGKIDKFDTKAAGLKATLTCLAQLPKCLASGWQSLGACAKMATICKDLNTYCKNCSSSGKCNNQGFGY